MLLNSLKPVPQVLTSSGTNVM